MTKLVTLCAGESLKGLRPFKNHPPPHDRNIYPYHGEGDKGGEDDKKSQISATRIKQFNMVK